MEGWSFRITTHFIYAAVLVFLFLWSEWKGDKTQGADSLSEWCAERLFKKWIAKAPGNEARQERTEKTSQIITIALGFLVSLSTIATNYKSIIGTPPPPCSTESCVKQEADNFSLHQQLASLNEEVGEWKGRCDVKQAESQQPASNCIEQQDSQSRELNVCKDALNQAQARLDIVEPEIQRAKQKQEQQTKREALQQQVDAEMVAVPAIYKGKPTLLVFSRDTIWHLSRHISDRFVIGREQLQVQGTKLRWREHDIDFKLDFDKEDKALLTCWQQGTCWETLRNRQQHWYGRIPVTTDGSAP